MTLENAVSELREALIKKHEEFGATFLKTVTDFKEALIETGLKKVSFYPAEYNYPFAVDDTLEGTSHLFDCDVIKFHSRLTRVSMAATFIPREETGATDVLEEQWLIALRDLPQPDPQGLITKDMVFGLKPETRQVLNVYAMVQGVFSDNKGITVPCSGIYGINKETKKHYLGINVARDKGIPEKIIFQFDYVRENF